VVVGTKRIQPCDPVMSEDLYELFRGLGVTCSSIGAAGWLRNAFG